MKITTIGGPLVTSLPRSINIHTPPTILIHSFGNSSEYVDEILLLPKRRYIEVVSAKTGVVLPYRFVTPDDDTTTTVEISCVCLQTRNDDRVVIWGGCRCGMILEWVLERRNVGGGDGERIVPRRTFDLVKLWEMQDDDGDGSEGKKDGDAKMEEGDSLKGRVKCAVLQMSSAPENRTDDMELFVVVRRLELTVEDNEDDEEQSKPEYNKGDVKSSKLSHELLRLSIKNSKISILHSSVIPHFRKGFLQLLTAIRFNSLLTIVASSQGITLSEFHKERPNPVKRVFLNRQESISSIALHPTEPHLILGQTNGHIVFLFRILHLFHSNPIYKLKDNTWTKDMTTKILHWHAHPVASLAFLDERTLLSGGEEAVLLFWKTGMNENSKTNAMIPRICQGPGGIIGLFTSHNNTDIYVLGGGDNTLSKYESFSRKLLYKIEGLAICPSNNNNNNNPRELEIKPSSFDNTNKPIISSFGGDGGPILRICPHTNIPLLSHLNGNPGKIQWIASTSSTKEGGGGRVVRSLECSQYNRVSKFDAESSRASLVPRVGLFVVLKHWLVCVEGTLVEVPSMGRPLVEDDGSESELVSLQFWRYDEERERYSLDCIMPFPHGRHAGVCGLVGGGEGDETTTTTDDGEEVALVCTVSAQENAFRVWTYHDKTNWKCLYKLSTPAGFAKPSGGIALSPDGSLLAVAYENRMVAFWAIQNGVLLKTHRADFCIYKMVFSPLEKLVMSSEYHVEIIDLVKGNEWGWNADHQMDIVALDVLEEERWVVVAASKFHVNEFGVKRYYESIVVLLEEDTGDVVKQTKDGEMMVWRIDAGIKAMCAGKGVIYCLTKGSKELLELTWGDHVKQDHVVVSTGKKNADVPKLDWIQTGDENQQKRKRETDDVDVDILLRGGNKGNLFSKMDSISSSNLPTLSGAFYKPFLERMLYKKKLMRHQIENEEEVV